MASDSVLERLISQMVGLSGQTEPKTGLRRSEVSTDRKDEIGRLHAHQQHSWVYQ